MTLNLSRAFLVIGSLYLLIGIGIGMYMGGSSEYTLAPLHAHINLVGFVLMSIFGLILRLVPAMAQNTLGKAHFWLFQIGAIIMLITLFVLLTERGSPATFGPVIFVGELLALGGVIAFVVNLYNNA